MLVFYRTGDNIIIGKKSNNVYFDRSNRRDEYNVWQDEGEMIRIGTDIKIYKKYVNMNKLNKVETIGRCLPRYRNESGRDLVRIGDEYYLVSIWCLFMSRCKVYSYSGDILWDYIRDYPADIVYAYQDEYIVWHCNTVLGFGQSRDWILSIYYKGSLMIDILDKNTRKIYKFEKKKGGYLMRQFRNSKPEVIDRAVKKLIKYRDINMRGLFKE